MKTLRLMMLFALLGATAVAQAPWSNGKLVVSPSGRYLQHANGQPFFWLADTCWLLSQKLDRAQVQSYFENRKAKGFNVVQCVVVQMLNDKSAYGDPALIEGDLLRLAITPGSNPSNAAEYDYWDHFDYIVETAATNGIYLAVAPTWSHTVRRAPVTKAQAESYAATLANRYRAKPNIIWLNGGSARGTENTDVWQAIGETIKQHAPDHLMTFHPFGRTQSSLWFQQERWLDLNMFTSGHRRYDQDTDGKKFGEDNWRYVLEDRAKTPAKPTVDGEPSFEDAPQGLHDGNQPYWRDGDVRRYAYWSVFAGAAGHSYGQNSVRQVYLPSDPKPASAAKGYFTEQLEAPGATQVRHLKNLILSRPYFDRINDQSAVAGDEGEKYDRILVTRGKDYLLAYTYSGREFEVRLGIISGAELNASWFNPRTGESTPAGTHKNVGTAKFNPPGEKANGNDWVLVLDDASKKFNPPGVQRR